MAGTSDITSSTDRWVLGVEGSVGGTTLTKALVIPAPNYFSDPQLLYGMQTVVTGVVRSGVQGSIRARAGYTFGRLLPFATAGVAVGSFQSDAQISGVDVNLANFAAAGSRSGARAGWTVGGGLEWAVNNHWSLRSEWRYTDFGHMGISTDPSAVGAVFVVDRHLDQQQVQVGFSYKLGPLEPEPMEEPKGDKGPVFAINNLFGSDAPPAGPPQPLDWTGIYIGAQIGYGWGLNDGSLTYATPGGLAGLSELGSNAVVVGGGSSKNGDAIGVIGGVHVGYNRQFDKWVVGLEGSVDPTLMSRGVTISVPRALSEHADLIKDSI